ncbi:unnamed protein product [Chrysoparadoxa australica]
MAQDGGQKYGGYAWERGEGRLWEGLEEDDSGKIKDYRAETKTHRVRHRLQTAVIRRGMLRYLLVCVDMSAAMSATDMRPNRLAVTNRLLEKFIKDFFDQNPLSQLGLMLTRAGKAEKITELSGNPKAHIEALKKAMTMEGDASLQNTMDLACSSLLAAPDYGNRELLIVYGSLSSCDPGDVFESITNLKKAKIRASVIGLSAELYICKKLSEETKGDYTVVLNETHYEGSLLSQCTPPPSTTTSNGTTGFAEMVQMGFPKRQDLQPSIGYSGHQQSLTATGYFCPRCKTKTTDLPSTCLICSLPLGSSPHLARSYHHLFPIPLFDEVAAPVVQDSQQAVQAHCVGCLSDLTGSIRYTCPDCKGLFCSDCDLLIHDSLHNCPGCMQ